MKLIILIAFLLSMAHLPLNAQDDGQRKRAAVEQAPSVEISASEGVIRVKNAPVGSVLEVYSVVGIKVKEIEMKQPSGDYYVNLAKGYYIIRIGGTVRKVAIR